MKNVEIYFKHWCSYSRRALRLLDSKRIQYTAYDITDDAVDKEQEMRERTGRTSVPQIFIGNTHVGGYDDLAALESSGRLDLMLRGQDAGRAA